MQLQLLNPGRKYSRLSIGQTFPHNLYITLNVVLTFFTYMQDGPYEKQFNNLIFLAFYNVMVFTLNMFI